MDATKIRLTAAVCHEVNRSYCLAIGDSSQVAWKDAPEWQKASAVDGVEFKLKNPGATPEQMHENWLEQKRIDGWKFGAIKDPEKKEHPCFVSYGELPLEQRIKDHLFSAVVSSMFEKQ